MKNNVFYKLAVLFTLSVFAHKCTYSNREPETVSLSADGFAIQSSEGSVFLNVSSNSDWTLSLTDEQNNSVQWARANKYKGSLNETVVLTFDANASSNKRYLIINAVAGKAKSSFKMVQNSSHEYAGGSSGDKPGVLPGDTPEPVTHYGWLEIPALGNPKLEYKIHMMNFKGRQVRNYSYYYDVKNKVSHWVAYPLTAAHIGRVKRSNNFTLDPLFPASSQAVLYRGYSPRGYDRGHQIPSKDRTFSREANDMTFYSTNMTPQKSEFNQNIWAKLEEKVRSWAYISDTVYVVTGCVLGKKSAKAYDNDRKPVSVPDAYYKAILRYKSGSSIGIRGYVGTAFYMDHNTTDPMGSINKYQITIKELEQKTGVTFFANLPLAIGESATDSLKYDSKKESAWWISR